MEAKTIQQAPDPALDAEKQQAQQDQVRQLQIQASADTSNLMARYGTKLALAGVMPTQPGTSPAVGTGR